MKNSSRWQRFYDTAVPMAEAGPKRRSNARRTSSRSAGKTLASSHPATTESRLFDEDRGARREPCRVEPFAKEMQCLQEVDAHRRLRGRGAPKLTEREPNQIVTVGLLDEHHTATPVACQPGRWIASEQFGEYRCAVENRVLCRGRIVDPS